MKKFSVTVVRTDEFEIEVDENVWDKAAIENWQRSFYPAETPEDIAKLLAGSITKLGSSYGFIEGFGNVRKYYPDGRQKHDYGEGFKKLPDDSYTIGLSVTLITEDEDYEVDINEIKK